MADDERATVRAVAEGYNELLALQAKQRDTTARMIRVCLVYLRSPDSRKRREAIDGLESLATMLEKPLG